MNEMTTKYPAIAIIDADGTLYHQVTFREDAPLFDRDAGGRGELPLLKESAKQASLRLERSIHDALMQARSARQ